MKDRALPRPLTGPAGLLLTSCLAATLLSGCFAPTIDIGVSAPVTPNTVARATAAAAQRGGDAQVFASMAALQATNDALSTRVAQPSATPVPPTQTPVPPTATAVPPTATTAPPSPTIAPPSPTRASTVTTVAGVPPAAGAPAAGSGPAAALDPGWTLHQRAEDGFAIGLPAGWTPINVAPETIATMTPPSSAQPGVNPQLAGAIAAATIRFVAVELTQESMATGNPGTAMVGRIPAAGLASLDDAARQYVAGLESNPDIDKPIERRRTDLPAGPAERVAHSGRSTVTSPTGPRQVQVAMTSFVWLRDGVAYVLMVGGPVERRPALEATADQIARAFRWHP